MGPHVTNPAAGVRERLSTILVVAFERFFFRMGPHVLNQVLGQRERLATIFLVALKRLLLCMGPHVSIQVVDLRERLFARLTNVGFLPRMRPYVFSQVAGRRERLSTILVVTFPRFLFRMRPRVHSQGSKCRESHFARLTDMRLLPRVGPQVNSQVVIRAAHFLTLLTGV